MTALVAVTVTFFTHALIAFKFALCSHILDFAGPMVAFVFYLFINLSFVFCANFMARTEPMAAGSGIPEIKAYLNGVVGWLVGFFFLTSLTLPLELAFRSYFLLQKNLNYSFYLF